MCVFPIVPVSHFCLSYRSVVLPLSLSLRLSLSRLSLSLSLSQRWEWREVKKPESRGSGGLLWPPVVSRGVAPCGGEGA